MAPFGPTLMSTFDRRSFLTSLLGSAGIAAAPEWLLRGMSPQDPATPQDPVVPWRRKQLAEAVAAARAEGKPLLVLLVPGPNLDGWERGQWFGAWLNHGGPAALHQVALCRLACASADDLLAVLGMKLAATPMLVAVDLGAYPTEPVRKATESPVVVGPIRLGEAVGRWPEEQYIVRQRSHVEAGVTKITEAVQDLLNRHGATVARVATDSMARLDDTQRAALAAWFTGQAKPADELIVRAAAEVRRAAGSVDETNRQRLLAALGEATTAVVVKRAVAGARWQKPGGCGADFEEPTPAEAKVQGMMACGMGFVPPLCERFLDLYTAGR